MYDGTVVDIGEEKVNKKKIYKVLYTDGDMEDLYEKELCPLLYKTGAYVGIPIGLGLGLGTHGHHTIVIPPSTTLTHTRTHTLHHHHTGTVDPMLKVQEYLRQRKRAIAVFTHYPVLDIKVHKGKGTGANIITPHTHNIYTPHTQVE